MQIHKDENVHLNKSVNYEILKSVLFIPKPEGKKYHIEVNIMRWYGGEPSLDIRKWDSEGRSGKGIALSFDEIREILDKKDMILELLEN